MTGEIKHITKLREKQILLDWKEKEDYETENGKDIVELEKKKKLLNYEKVENSKNMRKTI